MIDQMRASMRWQRPSVWPLCCSTDVALPSRLLDPTAKFLLQAKLPNGSYVIPSAPNQRGRSSSASAGCAYRWWVFPNSAKTSSIRIWTFSFPRRTGCRPNSSARTIRHSGFV